MRTTANLTCDEVMNVYVDGRQIKEEKTGYRNADEFEIPIGSSVLAIQCAHKTLVPRILGIIGDSTVTGSQGWVCTNQYHPQWNTAEFVDSLWSSAVTYGKNVDSNVPHGKIGNISSEAEWIGTGEKLSNNTTLYCRFSLCPMQSKRAIFLSLAIR